MRRMLLALSALCLLLLGAFVAYSIPASAQTGATPTPYPLPTKFYPPTTPVPIPNPPPDISPRWRYGELLAETDHFLIHANGDYFPVDVEQFAHEAEEVYNYVSARLDLTTGGKMGVLFHPPDPVACPETGYADHPTPGFEATIVLFADETTGHTQILGALAREVGRVLLRNQPWRLSGAGYTAGYPVWAAGRYWHAWQEATSFDESVRSYIAQSKYLPLYEHIDIEAVIARDCTGQREILPTEWASFIDFLLNEYGWGRFEALLRSPKTELVETDEGQAFYDIPADYQRMYGLELNQLEAQWLDHLHGEAQEARTPPRRVCPMCVGPQGLPSIAPAVPSAP